MVPEINNLAMNSFIVEINRIPILKYKIQTIDFPDYNINDVDRPTPFKNLHVVGDHPEQSDFNFSFIVDAKMENYLALYYWMRGISFPDEFEQFSNFVKGLNSEYNIESAYVSKKGAEFSDVTITILSNLKNPIISCVLHDAFPISLSGFTMDTTVADSTVVVVNCQMKFNGFELKKIV